MGCKKPIGSEKLYRFQERSSVARKFTAVTTEREFYALQQNRSVKTGKERRASRVHVVRNGVL